jgi:uncharacterized protein (DUF2141 family)
MLVLLGAALDLAAASAPPAASGAHDCTGRPSATRLYVRVEGVKSGEGLIAVTLYADDSRRFLARRGSLYVGRSPAKAGVTHACIFVPGPGVYAIVVYHDVNANRRLDRNMIGLPTEGGGFSNNPSTFLGLPSFRSVRFPVRSSGQTIRVKLRYP